VALRAELIDGQIVLGESRISRARRPIHKITLKPKRCPPLKEALDAIARADLITLGPGSLFTSVIPNLLVEGIPKAIRNSRAHKIYFSNLMWQPWETMQFSVADHIDAIVRHGGKGLIDTVVVNTRPIGGERRRRYAAEKVFPVEVDLPRLQAMGIDVVGRNLLDTSEKVRHDPDTVASIAIELAQMHRRRAR